MSPLYLQLFVLCPLEGNIKLKCNFRCYGKAFYHSNCALHIWEDSRYSYITSLVVRDPLLHFMSFFHLLQIHFAHQVTLEVIGQRKAPNLNGTDSWWIYTSLLLVLISKRRYLTCPSAEPVIRCLFSSKKHTLSSGKAKEIIWYSQNGRDFNAYHLFLQNSNYYAFLALKRALWHLQWLLIQ